MREYIKNVVLHYQSNYKRCLLAISNQEKVPNYSCDHQYVTIVDDHYPTCFFKLRYPPLCLFYQGDLSLLSKRCVGVIGARKNSEYSAKMTRHIVKQLAKTHCIVSGFAQGIDSIAHQASIKTVAFLGCGLNIDYPKSNKPLRQTIKECGCLISEYGDNVLPKRHHFPWRNRLIACASPHLLVMQASYHSGTMHTAKAAMELGHQVYCLPSLYDDLQTQGCHELINDGAMVLTKELVLDIIKESVGGEK